MANPLQQLADFQQSFWLDNLGRELIVSGELARLIKEDGLRGITSNPTIFQKSLAAGDAYDAGIEELARKGKSTEEIFETLAIEDIQHAADLLRPVYDAAGGGDGFVSLELPPYLATDTERSVSEAKRLFAQVARPNVMIKIPGTPAGLPAIEESLFEGINVNITLLFSLQVYEQVMEAYLRAMERRVEAGRPVKDINSVASFFVSRVDTEVDKRIDKMLTSARMTKELHDELLSLQGTVAIANAKLAYQQFKEVFLEGERFQKLAKQGVRLQRPLWASTSTKNPKYSDVLYIEALIGPHTVETMAPVSIDAFRDHGKVADNVGKDVEGAKKTLERLAAVGISLDEVTDLLTKEGVESFEKSYDTLLAGLQKKVDAVSVPSAEGSANLNPFEGDIRSTLARLEQQQFVERMWRKDPTLWSDDSSLHQKIVDRLGWLNVPDTMLERAAEFEALAKDVQQAGFKRALLLGMGGSSLAPELFQRTFGNRDGFPELTVVDTTDPDAIARIAATLDLDSTLFIVSSKSGTTIEMSSLYKYFADLLQDQSKQSNQSEPTSGTAGQHFIAVTDPGTKLEQLAKDEGFRHVFINPPDIGGRYSALSYFGLVPATVIGLDVADLLRRAARMVKRLHEPGADNPGLWLGVVMARLAQAGRDKVTFVFDPGMASLAEWLEQLLAESTGKQGTGLVPIADEPVGAPTDYGADRLFVGLDLLPQPHASTDAVLQGLITAGQPVVRLRIDRMHDIAAEFMRWEVATAVAGAVLQINPFDEPNVQESKDNTNRLLDGYRKSGTMPQPPVLAKDGPVSVQVPNGQAGGASSLTQALDAFTEEISLGNFVAIMAFMERSAEHEKRLQEIRRLLRDRLDVATTFGFGPRFMHSIGQLYKGGPQEGAFIQIVARPENDLKIPGEDFSFGTLFAAQSLGDYQSLEKRKRPLIRLTIEGDPVAGLDRILELVAGVAIR